MGRLVVVLARISCLTLIAHVTSALGKRCAEHPNQSTLLGLFLFKSLVSESGISLLERRALFENCSLAGARGPPNPV
jgi:hypothetical protein